MQSSPPLIHEVTHPDKPEPLGWLAVDTVVENLSFGGCRMSPAVTRAEVAELAAAMSWKLGCHGSPFGGAKGGIRVHPDSPDAPRLIGHFGKVLAPLLSESVVLGKDMGANDARMQMLYESVGVSQLSLLGVPGLDWLRELPGYRNHMTGLGIAFAAQAALGRNDLSGIRVAIQGAGMVGLGTAFRLSELGATVHAMSDVHQSRYWPEGVPVAELLSACAKSRDLSGVSTGKLLPRDDVFLADVDLLVLAASSYSVDPQAVASISAPWVVEGANMAFTREGRVAMDRRDVMVVPDVIASSSSAAMVCLQMAHRGTLEEKALWDRIRTGVTEAIDSGAKRSRHHGISLREAHVMSLSQVGAAEL